jgi:hypothetical protein
MEVKNQSTDVENRGEIIIVPEYKSYSGPLIFLAGPVQGAEDWQRRAIDLINAKNQRANVASPRGDYSNKKFDYNTQVDWESYHLSQAGREGVILFWLAKEQKHDCKRAYAQTTRYEIAEWVTKHQYDPNIKIAVGIEPGFTGERYIRKRLEEDCPDLAISSTLEDVCQKAISLLK